MHPRGSRRARPPGQGMPNSVRFRCTETALPAIDMASRNPCRLLGREEAELRPGSLADLFLFRYPGPPANLEILATGHVEGDINAQSVRIETGGVFRGTSRMGKEMTAIAPVAPCTGTCGATPTEELSGRNAEAA